MRRILLRATRNHVYYLDTGDIVRRRSQHPLRHFQPALAFARLLGPPALGDILRETTHEHLPIGIAMGNFTTRNSPQSDVARTDTPPRDIAEIPAVAEPLQTATETTPVINFSGVWHLRIIAAVKGVVRALLGLVRNHINDGCPELRRCPPDNIGGRRRPRTQSPE